MLVLCFVKLDIICFLIHNLKGFYSGLLPEGAFLVFSLTLLVNTYSELANYFS